MNQSKTGSNINSDHITATATENLVVSHPSPVISFTAVANPAVKPHQTHSLLKTNSTTSIHPILLPDIPRATSNHDTKHLPVESVTDEGTNDISTAIQNYNVTASTCPPGMYIILKTKYMLINLAFCAQSISFESFNNTFKLYLSTKEYWYCDLYLINQLQIFRLI